jgi:hypothetical protein
VQIPGAGRTLFSEDIGRSFFVEMEDSPRNPQIPHQSSILPLHAGPGGKNNRADQVSAENSRLGHVNLSLAGSFALQVEGETGLAVIVQLSRLI